MKLKFAKLNHASVLLVMKELTSMQIQELMIHHSFLEGFKLCPHNNSKTRPLTPPTTLEKRLTHHRKIIYFWSITSRKFLPPLWTSLRFLKGKKYMSSTTIAKSQELKSLKFSIGTTRTQYHRINKELTQSIKRLKPDRLWVTHRGYYGRSCWKMEANKTLS